MFVSNYSRSVQLCKGPRQLSPTQAICCFTAELPHVTVALFPSRTNVDPRGTSGSVQPTAEQMEVRGLHWLLYTRIAAIVHA